MNQEKRSRVLGNFLFTLSPLKWYNKDNEKNKNSPIVCV